jgi:4-diphosphocytidyl-2-C-methyl-D-erythritol kinase
LSTAARDIAAAKLNLALHVRGRRPDGRHDIETIFAFCVDGDQLSAEPAEELTLTASGPFAGDLPDDADNLVIKTAKALQAEAGITQGAVINLDKKLPVASGIGGGSADAAATLRLLTSLWQIDPKHASAVASRLGSDVPACLLSVPARGTGAGDELTQIELSELNGRPVLLVNPRVELSTAEVFAAWGGKDLGPLGDWRDGRNDLEGPAKSLVPQIQTVLAWLSIQPGAEATRMSGSGATCFALFDTEEARDLATDNVPREWWRLATFLR